MRAGVRSQRARTRQTLNVGGDARVHARVNRVGAGEQAVVIQARVLKSQGPSEAVPPFIDNASKMWSIVEQVVVLIHRRTVEGQNISRMIGKNSIGDVDGAGRNVERRVGPRRRVGNGQVNEVGAAGRIGFKQVERRAVVAGIVAAENVVDEAAGIAIALRVNAPAAKCLVVDKARVVDGERLERIHAAAIPGRGVVAEGAADEGDIVIAEGVHVVNAAAIQMTVVTGNEAVTHGKDAAVVNAAAAITLAITQCGIV